MSIAVAQPRCVAYDVTANAVAHAEAVRAADARVVVFPEMLLTGYELDAAPVSPDDERLAPIGAACAETGTLALVGAPVSGPRIGILAVDGFDRTSGRSGIWSADGELIAEASVTPDDVVRAVFSKRWH